MVGFFIQVLGMLLGMSKNENKKGTQTNAIESVNMSRRKVTKNRGSFPNDESMLKLLYLALKNISKKWTMPIRNWKSAMNQFTIIFENRMPTI